MRLRRLAMQANSLDNPPTHQDGGIIGVWKQVDGGERSELGGEVGVE